MAYRIRLVAAGVLAVAAAAACVGETSGQDPSLGELFDDDGTQSVSASGEDADGGDDSRSVTGIPAALATMTAVGGRRGLSGGPTRTRTTAVGKSCGLSTCRSGPLTWTGGSRQRCATAHGSSTPSPTRDVFSDTSCPRRSLDSRGAFCDALRVSVLSRLRAIRPPSANSVWPWVRWTRSERENLLVLKSLLG